MTKNKKVKTYKVGDDDHTACPRSSARKKAFVKANSKWDAEFFSTKFEIPNNVLNGFIAMNSKYHGDKITNRTENVQRVELLNMEQHFNTLKNSKLTSDESFYKQFADAVGQHDFIVKGYLTWSLRHEFQKPTEVVMHPDCNSDVSVSPLKICFLSVDPKHDYYLQIWKNSTTKRKTLQCPELVRVKHGFVRIFPGSTIHGGGFLNSKSLGNARIQLHVYKQNYHKALINNRFFKNYDFNNVTDNQLRLYNFHQPNVILGKFKHQLASGNSNDLCPVSQGNNCSESSSSKHQDKKIQREKNNLGADKTLNPNFTFTRGKIKQVVNPKVVLVPPNNQITQKPSSLPSQCWSSTPNKETTEPSVSVE